ncbi:SPOR domain-containing protein [Neiella marina]|uniref:SPOR domain-containing protein n=1 Tax=Neiella holothuriorum TaxID=2870530 RepID=A0ABS7ECM4_9GAMM|nr:SPOR domain-containing protein [Neiella holothuriorum]MBW8190051.1 SPOR domain-containing protein [Neiella holothuriorum]
MPRDYAKRKPAPKKKPARATSKPKGRTNQARTQQQSVGLPWLRIVIVVGLLAAFGYGLSQISGSADHVAETEPTSASPAPVESADNLPDKPQERWSFIEELETKQVEVDVPDAPEQTRPYLMQCGSFRIESQADELKAKIAFQGLSSEVRRAEGSKGVWYKVVLGPYKTKRLAETDRHTLQRASIRGCKIWYW